MCDPCALYLALLRGNGGVPVDEFGEDAAQSLDAQRQRSHVQQEHISDIAGQNSSLDCGSDGDGFIWIHRLAGGAAEQVLNGLLNLEDNTDTFKLSFWPVKFYKNLL